MAAMAATEAEKRTAIDDGLAWLASQQQANGSWRYSGGVEDAASTGAALLAFLEEKDNWGSNTAAYQTAVDNGVNYLLSRATPYNISVEPTGNPDTDGNGIGVKFVPGGNNSRDTYVTGLAMPAIAKVAAATPGTLVTTGPLAGRTDGTGAGGAWTYKDVVQNTVDYFAYGQADPGNTARGGWRYYADYGESDNSTAQWPPIAMLYAQAVDGVTVPAFVKSEHNYWIDYIQNAGSGGSGYDNPNSLVNQSKTGGLLAEMAFTGYNGSGGPTDTGGNSTLTGALDYLNVAGNWQAGPSGTWDGNFGHPYAMWSIYKGLELTVGLDDTTAITNLLTDCGAARGAVDPGDTCNWWEDYSEWLVNNQRTDGAWTGYSNWGPILATPWNINILAATEIPGPDPDPMPAPGTLMLMAGGLLGAKALRRWRKQS
jgi:hypothetical protein